VKVWSGSLGQPVGRFGDESNGAALCVAFHREGQQVLAGFHSGQLRLYDITTGMVMWYAIVDIHWTTVTLFFLLY